MVSWSRCGAKLVASRLSIGPSRSHSARQTLLGTTDDHRLGWGVLSGAGTGVGVAFLYRAMGKGAMSLVVPASDVAAVVLPVLFGLLLSGQRLSLAAVAGVCRAVPALWLVSWGTREKRTAAGILDAFVAGLGFAVQFVAL